MRTPIIAGNWKMNKTAEEAVNFVREIRHGTKPNRRRRQSCLPTLPSPPRRV